MLPAELHRSRPCLCLRGAKGLGQRLLTSGSEAVGYKIALSSPTAQALCNVTHPVYAPIGLNVYESGSF